MKPNDPCAPGNFNVPMDWKTPTNADGAPALAPAMNTIRPNVRAALDYLDGILSKGGQDAQDLWDVLSALRGPDDGGADAKVSVTIPIRRNAFPRTRHAVNHTLDLTCGVHRRADFGYHSDHSEYCGSVNADGAHFSKHGYHAAVALGLI